ncbi:unnamed protein product [Enterobius vermicularis]|uniref:PX domain-containing protein n=1 Tax=Enterobius vermicularis TaxID=51028 RepID=A0A0N4V9U6_ENTVE|nr:unnamed protein product [Enterobius vermicularis]
MEIDLLAGRGNKRCLGVNFHDSHHDTRHPNSYGACFAVLNEFQAYNLHVNGAYHASVRYSKLLRFHGKLHEHFGSDLKLAEFPAKKFFRNLDKNAIKERRLGLAAYFQSLVQQPAVAQHYITECYFLSFQVDSFRPSSNKVLIDISLPDGSSKTIRCSVQHSPEIVLKRFAEDFGIERSHAEKFGLFIARKRGYSGGSQLMAIGSEEEYPDFLCKKLDCLPIIFVTIFLNLIPDFTAGVRLLRNFESPYVSLQLLNRKSAPSGVFYCLLIRKLVWDPKVEITLFNDPGAVLLLYKQAVCELRNGKINPLHESEMNELIEAEKKGASAQFLRLCYNQPTYGYECLEDCVSDYPAVDTHCHLKVGRRCIVLDYADLNNLVSFYPNIGLVLCVSVIYIVQREYSYLILFKMDGNKITPVSPLILRLILTILKDGRSQAVFRATRIRVWRIAQIADCDPDFIFQFEYLMSKELFKNITLRTRQAVLLSLIMQSFGAEILKHPRLANYQYLDVRYMKEESSKSTNNPVLKNI